MKKQEVLHSEQIQAGKRTYFFDLKQSEKSQHYLVITQSQRKVDDTFDRQRIILNEQQLIAFGSSLMNCMILFRQSDKLSRDESREAYIESVRENYPNAYRPWSKEDDLALEIYLGEEMEITELSSFFQRKESAIKARIEKLGLAKSTAA